MANEIQSSEIYMLKGKDITARSGRSQLNLILKNRSN